jgi:hypothetical protein
MGKRSSTSIPATMKTRLGRRRFSRRTKRAGSPSPSGGCRSCSAIGTKTADPVLGLRRLHPYSAVAGRLCDFPSGRDPALAPALGNEQPWGWSLRSSCLHPTVLSSPSNWGEDHRRRRAAELDRPRSPGLAVGVTCLLSPAADLSARRIGFPLARPSAANYPRWPY